MSKIKAIFLVLINCIMLVSGQILWKIGLREASMGSVKEIILLLFNKYIFSGLVIYALATIYWFYIIKTNDLSKVYPMQSMSYIISLFMSYFILKENISFNSVIGTIVILIGVFIIAIK
ncbi:EamA family transporter [Clostridium sp. B9]|uniref:EamA family transporter n=1 Tax=Clostridium sp. B9 TaxID=3423224 RepID=UPI003D2F1BF6